MLITPWASMIGSAWLTSPWLRSQSAHSSTSLVALPLGSVGEELPLPVAVEPPLPLPLLVGKLATVWELAALGELEPPHAASPTAAAATRTASLVATPPAAPPTRAPATAARATTRLVENSATGARPRVVARPAVATRHGPRSAVDRAVG